MHPKKLEHGFRMMSAGIPYILPYSNFLASTLGDCRVRGSGFRQVKGVQGLRAQGFGGCKGVQGSGDLGFERSTS